MQQQEDKSSSFHDLLRKLESLKQDNKLCLKTSQEVIEKTKNIVLRSSKFL